MLSSEFRARQCDLGKLLVLRGAMSQGHQSPITYCCMMKHPNPLGLKPQAFGPLSISMSWNLWFHWGLRNFSAFLRFPSLLGLQPYLKIYLEGAIAKNTHHYWQSLVLPSPSHGHGSWPPQRGQGNNQDGGDIS